MGNNVHVSYDLNAPDKNYERVISKIKTLGAWAKIHKSFWYLDTQISAQKIAEAVWSVMDANDSLYVVDASTNTAYWYNIPADSSKFIQERWHRLAA